jgi:hypothetical protein
MALKKIKQKQKAYTKHKTISEFVCIIYLMLLMCLEAVLLILILH